MLTNAKINDNINGNGGPAVAAVVGVGFEDVEKQATFASRGRCPDEFSVATVPEDELVGCPGHGVHNPIPVVVDTTDVEASAPVQKKALKLLVVVVLLVLILTAILS